MDEQTRGHLMETMVRHGQSYIQESASQWQIRLSVPSMTKNTFYRIIKVLRNTQNIKEEKPREYLEVRPYVSGHFDDKIALQLYDVHSIQDYCLNENYEGLMKNTSDEENSDEENATSKRSWSWMKQKRFEMDVLPEVYTIKQTSVVNQWETVNETPSFQDKWSTMDKTYRYNIQYVYSDKDDKVDYVINVRKSTSKPFSTMLDANIPYIPEEYHFQVAWREKSVKKDKLRTPLEEMSRTLYRHALRFMQIIQGEPMMLTVSDIDRIMTGYGALVRKGRFIPRDKPDDSKTYFLAPKPVTLEKMHLVEPGKAYCVTSVLENYAVTEKADGERMLMYIDNLGDAYLINNVPLPKYTGLKCTSKEYYNTLLDGEYVENEHLYDKEETKDLFAVFDIYFVNGENVSSLPLIGYDKKKGRFDWIQQVCHSSRWNDSRSMISLRAKTHYAGNMQEMFKHCATILTNAEQKKTWYPIDGLIFTPTRLPVLGYYPDTKVEFSYGMRWDRVFKWKPAELNTIDFLARKGARIPGPDGKLYQEFVLQTGFNVDQMMNMTVYDGLKLLYNDTHRKQLHYGEGEYVPHPFRPFSYYQDNVHIAHIPLDNAGHAKADNGDVLKDDIIVEFAYDVTDKRSVSYRWKPLRVRDDKTRLYRKISENGTKNLSKTANDASTATNVWRSIHNPVTRDMIEGKVRVFDEEVPCSVEERINADDDVYYAREIPRFHLLSKNMLNFHNTFIKDKLYNVPGPHGSLLELACGRAGDLSRWCSLRYGFVLGIDNSKDNIVDPKEGSYARTIQMLIRKEKDIKSGKYDRRYAYIPPIIYAVGDCAQPVKDGTAAYVKDDDLSADVLKYVFNNGISKKHSLDSILPKLRGKGKNGFDVVSCQFALHYFFESREKLDGFFTNVVDNLKTGGHFIATFMDGKRVDALLTGKDRAEGIVKDSVIWAILKGYKDGEFSESKPYGNKIRVYLENINQLIPEYLVNVDFLIKYANTRGLTLLASQTFGETLEEQMQMSHPKSLQRILDEYVREDPKIKQFSHLNRWVIFKKM